MQYDSYCMSQTVVPLKYHRNEILNYFSLTFRLKRGIVIIYKCFKIQEFYICLPLLRGFNCSNHGINFVFIRHVPYRCSKFEFSIRTRKSCDGSPVTGLYRLIYIFKLDPSLLKAISCSFQNFFTERFEAQRFILSFVQFRSIIWNKRRGLRLKIEIDQYLGKISGRILKGGVQVETKSKKLETLQSVSKFGFYYRLIRYPNFINFSGFFS